MNRVYFMTVYVEFTDVQKDTSAGPAGPSLRARSESVEVAIATAIQAEGSRGMTRKGIRVNVTAANLREEP